MTQKLKIHCAEKNLYVHMQEESIIWTHNMHGVLQASIDESEHGWKQTKGLTFQKYLAENIQT